MEERGGLGAEAWGMPTLEGREMRKDLSRELRRSSQPAGGGGGWGPGRQGERIWTGRA